METSRAILAMTTIAKGSAALRSQGTNSRRDLVLVERVALVVAMEPRLMLVNHTDHDATNAG